MVEFGDGTLGLALNLQYQTISVVRFANTFNSTGVMEGSLVRTSGNVAKIPVGHVYINRMVNALGSTIDGKESVSFLVRVKEALEDPQRLLLDI